ncbi:MAG: CpaF family protein, partial [Hyphomonas sp.]
MFSRFKKSNGEPARPPVSSAPVAEVASAPREVSQRAPVSAPRPSMAPPKPAAQAAVQDKEKKRKDRLMELKVELHKRLLDNLNLAALEHATEGDLRSEIADISTEALAEMNVVLNKEDRTALYQELYDEVMGLGPIEPLLKDDSVNDILINGPKQIFIERSGKLMLSDITFKDERHLLRIIDKIVSAVGRRV